MSDWGRGCSMCDTSICQGGLSQEDKGPGQNGKTTDSIENPFNKFYRSMQRPLKFRFENHKIPKSELPVLFKVLKERAMNFLQEELMKLERHLSQDDSACFEHQGECEDITDGADQQYKNSATDGALCIALYILRTMKQMDVADTMEKDRFLMDYQNQLMHKLRKKFKCIFQGKGNAGQESGTPFDKIYTEAYVTTSGPGAINLEHEVRQIEMMFRTSAAPEVTIKHHDILKPSPGQEQQVRTVLTKGIAGIGKTVCVQKFILDWAEGRANQDIHFIFPLPFRDLNLMRHKECSLYELLDNFLPECKGIRSIDLNSYKVVFVFDGLDECRLPLNFNKNTHCCSPTQRTTVDGLLTNLIKGNLLPSALLWITSRPVAAGRIPPQYVHQVNELRGFNDLQKEDYFKKRFSDQELAQTVIEHVKSSRSLYIMCHIPVFCWISATVFEKLLDDGNGSEIPTSLTQIYTQFLVSQTSAKSEKLLQKQKEPSDSHTDFILNMGKLAYCNLLVGNLKFYKEDLMQCGADAIKASVESGLLTEIIQEEDSLCGEKVYCFVHLSIQEYLAALYVFLKKKWKNKSRTIPLQNANRMLSLLKDSVDKALLNINGHLDLFLRFLVGLSHSSNKTLLQNLLNKSKIPSCKSEEIAEYIKEKIRENPSPERTVNLFHCLSELHDHSLTREIQSYLDSGALSTVRLTPSLLSALAFVLLVSQDELDVFDLKKYTQANNGLLRLLPVVKASRTALLNRSSLTSECCEDLALVVRSSSGLRVLDLSENYLMNTGMKCLSAGLGNPQCKLETVKLSCCGMTEVACTFLASALKSNPSHLRELDLSYNQIEDSGLIHLLNALQEVTCNLEKLRLNTCDLAIESCKALAVAISSSSSPLKEVDLSHNNLGNSGAAHLTRGLGSPECKLEVLRLSGCQITEIGCDNIAAALHANPSHLKELDLSDNSIRDTGVKVLSTGLKDPNIKLEKLMLSGCKITEEGCCSLVLVLQSVLPHLKQLDLSYNYPGDTGVVLLSTGLESPNCKLEKLRLKRCGLTKACCELLASAISSNFTHLKELDLSDNDLENSGLKIFSAGLGNPKCKLETLGLSGCQISEEGCTFLTSALHSNPSHLKELDLSYNHPGQIGLTLLSGVLKDPKFQLKTLSLDHAGNNRLKPGLKKYACQLTLDPDTAHQCLLLSNRDRKVTYVEENQPYPEHPGRFDCWPQVLCRESLSGRCYWEVEWSGEEVHIAVAYSRVGRQGWGEESCLGQNAVSWNLEYSGNDYQATHNSVDVHIDVPVIHSCRIGVYLDWPAGILSFYSLFANKRILLHTFRSTFSEPVQPGFTVCSGTSVSLCLVP